MLANKWGLLLIVMMSVTACSKKETTVPVPQPVPAPAKNKLAKILFDSGAYDSLYYDPAGKLVKVKTVWNPLSGTGVTYFFDYNAQGKVTRIYSDQNEEYRYSYTDGKLEEVGLYISGLKTKHKWFGYDQQGVLTSTSTFTDVLTNPNDQDFLDMSTYTYYADGNLKTETAYSINPTNGIPVKETTITYSDYDNNPNPDEVFKQMPYFFGLSFFKNNARFRAIKNERTGEEFNYLFTYTYNQATLPISRKFEYFGNGSGVEGTCTYSYY